MEESRCVSDGHGGCRTHPVCELVKSSRAPTKDATTDIIADFIDRYVEIGRSGPAARDLAERFAKLVPPDVLAAARDMEEAADLHPWFDSDMRKVARWVIALAAGAPNPAR